MSVATAMMSVPKPAPALIEAFRNAPTSIIGGSASGARWCARTTSRRRSDFQGLAITILQFPPASQDHGD
jgi:hypothetical protein